TTIRVTSTPASATILLDGRSTGKKTPATLVVTPGSHTVTLQLSGYNQASRTVTAVKGKATTASITLTQPAPVAQGSLKVTSTPAGATVTVDGKVVKGVTPLTVSVTLGTHTVKVALAGYQTVTRTGVNVVKGIQTVTAVTLVPVTQLVSYTDSTYGYGFKYPATWQVAHVAGETEVRAPTGPRVRVAVAPLGGKTVQAFAASLHDALQQQGGLTVTSPATRTIAGIQYQHVAAAGGGTTTDYYLLASGGSVYQLECSAATDAADSAAADFRAILGSFFAAP
ncbi:MAG TPA: PEGA domain-containing protein, partial [Candidatus Cryosericum sp.]|nr:PEGA domain-containing protein [Candidatus Cryosericum sp.]